MMRRVIDLLWSAAQLGLMIIAAPAAIGWSVGHMASLAPPDSSGTVYAAVLPAIISLVGFLMLSGAGLKKESSNGRGGWPVHHDILFCPTIRPSGWSWRQGEWGPIELPFGMSTFDMTYSIVVQEFKRFSTRIGKRGIFHR